MIRFDKGSVVQFARTTDPHQVVQRIESLQQIHAHQIKPVKSEPKAGPLVYSCGVLGGRD